MTRVKRIGLIVASVALVALGGAAGWFGPRETAERETPPEPARVSATTTQAQPAGGLPEAVAKARDALLQAAESGDLAEVQALVPDTGFEYTFGSPVPGGQTAYWQELERTSGEKPLEALAKVLRMPYTLSRGYYVWPFAYDVASVDDLTAHERELLASLGPLETVFVEGTGDLGWRAGIRPDGTWVFFVAGD